MSASEAQLSSATPDALDMTTSIVAAYVGHNKIGIGALPALIQSVHASLSGVGKAVPVVVGKPEPAVPVKKSIHPDFIVCLEDGKHFKMLKRYLKSTYNLTPDEYRARWSLPWDYPMVAPNYTRQRSQLAKSFGLGHSTGTRQAKPPAKRGRPKKAAA